MRLLTANFSLRELTRSEWGERHSIDNTPNERQIERLTALCSCILEPLRDLLGKPIHINSGYRSPAINRAIGGALHSQHMRGQAADIEVSGVSNYALASLIEKVKNKELPFDELILENYIPGDKESGWVHVSYTDEGLNRRNVLTKKKGFATYEPGLLA